MTKIVWALVVSLFAFAAVGCSNDEGTGDGDPTATTESAGSPDEPDDECASLAEAAFGDQATRSFPDNAGVVWDITEVTVDDGQTTVEAVPRPDEVGYPAFQFVSRCDGDDVELLGAYALDGGEWVLLFTTDATGAADLPPSR